MIRSLILALIALAVPAAAVRAQAPDHSADVRAALERLPISAGVWDGEAWFQRGPGAPDTVLVHERVEDRLEGMVMLIEGTGRQKSTGEVVHHAFATLGWDPAASEYRMTAWLANGNRVDADTELADGVFTWAFDVPGGPRIRYRIVRPEPGVWQEDGEASLDAGATWFPFFGMTLRRTGGPDE